MRILFSTTLICLLLHLSPRVYANPGHCLSQLVPASDLSLEAYQYFLDSHPLWQKRLSEFIESEKSYFLKLQKRAEALTFIEGFLSYVLFIEGVPPELSDKLKLSQEPLASLFENQGLSTFLEASSQSAVMDKVEEYYHSKAQNFPFAHSSLKLSKALLLAQEQIFSGTQTHIHNHLTWTRSFMSFREIKLDSMPYRRRVSENLFNLFYLNRASVREKLMARHQTRGWDIFTLLRIKPDKIPDEVHESFIQNFLILQFEEWGSKVISPHANSNPTTSAQKVLSKVNDWFFGKNESGKLFLWDTMRSDQRYQANDAFVRADPQTVIEESLVKCAKLVHTLDTLSEQVDFNEIFKELNLAVGKALFNISILLEKSKISKSSLRAQSAPPSEPLTHTSDSDLAPPHSLLHLRSRKQLLQKAIQDSKQVESYLKRALQLQITKNPKLPNEMNQSLLAQIKVLNESSIPYLKREIDLIEAIINLTAKPSEENGETLNQLKEALINLNGEFE